MGVKLLGQTNQWAISIPTVYMPNSNYATGLDLCYLIVAKVWDFLIQMREGQSLHRLGEFSISWTYLMSQVIRVFSLGPIESMVGDRWLVISSIVLYKACRESSQGPWISFLLCL